MWVCPGLQGDKYIVATFMCIVPSLSSMSTCAIIHMQSMHSIAPYTILAVNHSYILAVLYCNVPPLFIRWSIVRLVCGGSLERLPSTLNWGQRSALGLWQRHQRMKKGHLLWRWSSRTLHYPQCSLAERMDYFLIL